MKDFLKISKMKEVIDSFYFKMVKYTEKYFKKILLNFNHPDNVSFS